MIIDVDILLTWGAIAKKYQKGEYVFHEEEHPRFYFQIISGKIRLYNTSFEGKEFTQAEFGSGDSFGEPPLFIDEVYPSTAIVAENSVIVKISKEKFFDIIDEYPLIQKKIIQKLSQRIYDKTITSREIINNAPEGRILAFLNSYKKKAGCNGAQLKIPYTRQEIANFTGLRVETVIRALKKMEDLDKVKIVNRKLIF